MRTVLITGGRGLIGTALTRLLVSRGYQVIIMTRDRSSLVPITGTNPIGYAHWDVEGQTIDETAIQQADFIVHLAGAGVADKRWTAARKQEIAQSRVKSSALIVKALREIPNQVQAVISASAIGWYGPDNPNGHGQPFVETAPADQAFLGETCRLWEEGIHPVTALGKRLVILRTGIVLAKEGGAYLEFRKPAQFGVGAILGNGRQIVSWIHMEDLCRIYLEAIENNQWSGVYNAVAPHPVSNKTLTLELASQLKGKFYIPVQVPSLLLKILLGEMSIEVLKSATVSAQKIKDTGFQFIYPSIESALNELKRK